MRRDPELTLLVSLCQHPPGSSVTSTLWQWTLSRAGCFPVKVLLRVSWQAVSVAARCPLCRFNWLWIRDNVVIELGSSTPTLMLERLLCTQRENVKYFSILFPNNTEHILTCRSGRSTGLNKWIMDQFHLVSYGDHREKNKYRGFISPHRVLEMLDCAPPVHWPSTNYKINLNLTSTSSTPRGIL